MQNTKKYAILVSSGQQENPMSPRKAVSVLYSDALFISGMASCSHLNGDENLLAERFDGLLLSGGGDLSPDLFGQLPHEKSNPPDLRRDSEEFALIEAFCAKRKAILGICRGIQVLNVFFGGDIVQDIPNHDGKPHTVKIMPDNILNSLYGNEITVNSYHHQAIGRLANGFSAIAYSKDGVIEAVMHNSLPILAVQWHAERMVKGLCMDTQTDQTDIFKWLYQPYSSKEINKWQTIEQ